MAAPLTLRPLRPDDEAEALAAHAETLHSGVPFLLDPHDDEPWRGYLARLDAQRRGRDVPDGWVPHTLLAGEVDGVIVGRLSLRHRLTPWLREIGGHVGYVVRPGHRGRGYATDMLRAALPLAAGLGIDRVLVTCDDDNPASARVIAKCGGVPDSPVRVPSGPLKLRFWIDVR